MIHTNPKSGETYEDGINVKFKTKTVSEMKSSKAHYLSMKELRAFVDKTRDLPDETPVFADSISESLLTGDSGWHVIPLLWEDYEWSPGIAQWQIFVTRDKEFNIAVMLSAHY